MLENEWLQMALSLSMRLAEWAKATAKDAGSPPKKKPDPRFAHLLDGLKFTAKFVPTYHLVIVGFILIVAVVHWTDQALLWNRRRTRRSRREIEEQDYEDTLTTPSSPTRTLVGSESPPSLPPKNLVQHVEGDEHTPLLPDTAISETTTPELSRSITSRTISRIRAFLIYQPRPIPYVNKVLPSNGSIIILTTFIALNIFYLIFHIPFTTYNAFIFADRAGFLFVSNLPLLYTLSAKTQPLKPLLGASYESLNIFHRRLGEILCFEALVHTIGVFITWLTILRPVGFTFARFLSSPVILLGIGAFLSYETLYFTSLASFRQRFYEFFLASHIFLQTAGLVFVYFHHTAARPYVLAALAIILLDRLFFRLFLNRTTHVAAVSVHEDGETVQLTIPSLPLNPYAFFRTSISSGWKATDHVFITIPSLGRTHALQAHPFTIFSPAPAENAKKVDLQLLIRALDGFSRDLLMKAYEGRTLSVRLDGPYGSSHARDLLGDSDVAIVVAGGSGIAVAWPLIHSLLTPASSLDSRSLPTSVKNHTGVKVIPGKKSVRQHIVLIWVIHKAAHLEWVGRPGLADLENRGVEVHVPRATEEIGRPDVGGLVRGFVDDHTKDGGMMESRGSERIRRRVGVVASGPDGLNRSVRNVCAEMVKEGQVVRVGVEKFGW